MLLLLFFNTFLHVCMCKYYFCALLSILNALRCSLSLSLTLHLVSNCIFSSSSSDINHKINSTSHDDDDVTENAHTHERTNTRAYFTSGDGWDGFKKAFTFWFLGKINLIGICRYIFMHIFPIVKKSVNSKQLHFILCLLLVSFVITASFEKCINYLLSFFENIVARFAPDAQRYVTNYETKIKIQTNVQNRHSLLERCHRGGYFKSC